MEWQSKGHPPLIPSQLSAKMRVEQWAQAHSPEIRDGDGLVWHLHVESSQTPAADSVKELRWEISLQLKTSVRASELVATGTLDARDDERLLSLLGEDSVEFALRPQLVSALQEEDAYRQAGGLLRDYLAAFQKTDLRAIKRRLVGRYINNRMQFRECD